MLWPSWQCQRTVGSIIGYGYSLDGPLAVSPQSCASQNHEINRHQRTDLVVAMVILRLGSPWASSGEPLIKRVMELWNYGINRYLRTDLGFSMVILRLQFWWVSNDEPENHALFGYATAFVIGLSVPRVYTDVVMDWIMEFGYGLLDFVVSWVLCVLRILRVFWIRLGGPHLREGDSARTHVRYCFGLSIGSTDRITVLG